jgi:hypothetical protein
VFAIQHAKWQDQLLKWITGVYQSWLPNAVLEAAHRKRTKDTGQLLVTVGEDPSVPT